MTVPPGISTIIVPLSEPWVFRLLDGDLLLLERAFVVGGSIVAAGGHIVTGGDHIVTDGDLILLVGQLFLGGI